MCAGVVKYGKEVEYEYHFFNTDEYLGAMNMKSVGAVSLLLFCQNCGQLIGRLMVATVTRWRSRGTVCYECGGSDSITNFDGYIHSFFLRHYNGEFYKKGTEPVIPQALLNHEINCILQEKTRNAS